MRRRLRPDETSSFFIIRHSGVDSGRGVPSRQEATFNGQVTAKQVTNVQDCRGLFILNDVGRPTWLRIHQSQLWADVSKVNNLDATHVLAALVHAFVSFSNIL
jgi:hypothetical protein